MDKSHKTNIQPIIKKLKNIKVAIVERDLKSRNQIQTILDKYGINNRTIYTHVRDALDDIMCGAWYDIVLIDWELKQEVEASEFTSKIRVLGKSMPIVFAMGSNLVDYYKAFEAGASNIIRKPFVEKDVIDIIWSGVDIESFRRNIRVKDYFSLKQQAFFFLAAMSQKV